MNHQDYDAHNALRDTPKRINRDVYPPYTVSLVPAIHGLFWVCLLGAVIGTAFKLWETGKWKLLLSVVTGGG
jgi:hypothetical protein